MLLIAIRSIAFSAVVHKFCSPTSKDDNHKPGSYPGEIDEALKGGARQESNIFANTSFRILILTELSGAKFVEE